MSVRAFRDKRCITKRTFNDGVSGDGLVARPGEGHHGTGVRDLAWFGDSRVLGGLSLGVTEQLKGSKGIRGLFLFVRLLGDRFRSLRFNIKFGEVRRFYSPISRVLIAILRGWRTNERW